MSSNRLMYDQCAYEQNLNQSTGPGNYIMYPGKYEHCKKCRMQLGQVGGNGVSLYDGNMVDLESNLLGIDRQASMCDKSKYKPKCKNCKQCKNNGLPCSCLACTSQNLVHQPNCQMVNYKPVVPAPPFTPQTCDFSQVKHQPMYRDAGSFWNTLASWFN